MGDQREGGIAWTEQTWNPIRGCSDVSPGCAHCYAKKVAARFSEPGQPYEGLAKFSDKRRIAQWTGLVRPIPKHLADPIRWRRPRRIFVNSMSDLFHEALPRDEIAAILGVMCLAGHHTYQVLTKRSARMRELVSSITLEEALDAVVRRDVAMGGAQGKAIGNAMRELGRDLSFEGPLCTPSWIWYGVSAENQATANKRIPDLLETPAAVRWVSQEPQIGPIDYAAIPDGNPFSDDRDGFCHGTTLDWVVIGGESGGDGRPFDIGWARKTVAQARDGGVAVFVKQLGAYPCTVGDDEAPVALVLNDEMGGDVEEWPEDLRVREYPQ